MALPRSLPALPRARSRSTWSARSEARTYDVDGRRVAAIVGDEVGPDHIHDQRLQDRQLGPKLTRNWGQNSGSDPYFVMVTSPSGGHEDALAEQWEAGTAVHLALDHRDLVDGALHDSGVPGDGQAVAHGVVMALGRCFVLCSVCRLEIRRDSCE